MASSDDEHSSEANSTNYAGLVFSTHDQFNPHDKPPLGLKLDITPELQNQIQAKIDEDAANASAAGASSSATNTASASTSTANEKFEASTFPATLLKIGTWEYVPRNEIDLEVKFDFSERKIHWEFLKDDLKHKVEFSWDDITSLKGDFPENGSESLTIMLDKQPNCQPSFDFTARQEERLPLKHYVECSSGVLNEHFEKLKQCDRRLALLSQQLE
ncbi:uncharacterized protein LOC127264978 [Andrographis paniculata]|uniref:uncharacterized protein LOC127264978 n=1 Tax=Andrographis paniculata TaxID=175694 RepID=UPI0021E8509F|nr:uncharacterized protein LOC127264978 [Andrographis paniculata]